MQQRLTIITLGVSDLKKATEFYETKFGWLKNSSSNEHVTFFTLNGIQLGLYERNKLAADAKIDALGSGFKGFTLAYNVNSKKEVDELTQHLKGKGVKIIKKPVTTNWGGYHSYVADIESNLWEIAFNPFLELDEKGNVNQ